MERFLIKSFVYICKGLVLVHRHIMKPRNVGGKTNGNSGLKTTVQQKKTVRIVTVKRTIMAVKA
ncbi:hypothetical protein, partial [Flavobacterium psychrophilum]|uniref:hypothetical protein n=1 Tax=Flavobacterium psychrophilum TaxID=96345 RepID=UPI001D066E4D